MPRSRRGFQLQQFLPGNIVPSTASKPTGVVPENPMSLGSMQNPPFSAQAPAAPSQNKISLSGGDIMKPAGVIAGAAQAPVAQASKFAEIQKALGGITIGNNLLTKQKVLGSSMLGADALGTDWGKLFSYQGMGKDLISAALKQYGISAPTGGFGAKPDMNAWMKQMGLV